MRNRHSSSTASTTASASRSLASVSRGRVQSRPSAAARLATSRASTVVWSSRCRSTSVSSELTDVLRQRLDQTTVEAREVASLAAALGRDCTLPLLTEASDLDAAAVLLAVDELWRYRIVQELNDGYDFSHDLLRETAYTSVSPPRRWLLHRRLAQGLELIYAGHTDEV